MKLDTMTNMKHSGKLKRYVYRSVIRKGLTSSILIGLNDIRREL